MQLIEGVREPGCEHAGANAKGRIRETDHDPATCRRFRAKLEEIEGVFVPRASKACTSRYEELRNHED